MPSQMVCVSVSVNLPLHHKVQKFSSGTGSPRWSWKEGRKTVVVNFNHRNITYDGDEISQHVTTRHVLNLRLQDDHSISMIHITLQCLA